MIPIDKERTTLEQVREVNHWNHIKAIPHTLFGCGTITQKFEVVEERNMIRRNPMYQEFMATVSTLPNPYEYNPRELRKYRYGVIDKSTVRADKERVCFLK